MTQEKQFVTVDKIAVAFRISEKAVHKLVIYDGMHRKSRGEYDLMRCLTWYASHLHAKIAAEVQRAIARNKPLLILAKNVANRKAMAQMILDSAGRKYAPFPPRAPTASRIHDRVPFPEQPRAEFPS